MHFVHCKRIPQQGSSLCSSFVLYFPLIVSDAFSSGIRPPADPKGPPLILFKKSIFGRPTLKFFQRRLRRQYILILRGDRAPKKPNFSVKIFQKVPKNAFFGLFFQNSACGAKNLTKIGTKPCFGRARKINLVDLKNFFLKIRPPPRENPRSAPIQCTVWPRNEEVFILFKFEGLSLSYFRSLIFCPINLLRDIVPSCFIKSRR